MAKGVMRSTKTRDGIAAMLADNIGYLEEDMWDIQQEWLAQHATFDDMQDALEQAGLRVLNRPNLIKQNWWTNGTGVEHPVVYGRDSRIGCSTYPYLTSYNGPTESTQTTAPTAEQKAAATSIYSETESGVTTYHIFVDDDDIRATVADLAAADQIAETDGESYVKAINFDITANSAYGNTEWLLYCNPYGTRTYRQGSGTVRNYGQIEEMQPGHRYSLSCWVRVLSGDGAWIRMGYGNSYSNQPYDDSTNHRSGISDWIKVEPLNGAWQRISWTFDFNPVGDWYTETSTTETVNNEEVTTVTRTYNWYKKVGFGIGRKYTAVVQMCGFRLVEGRTFVCDTYDDLEEDMGAMTNRVAALETGAAANKTALLAIMAESDDETATAPHAVGDLITVGDALYKVTSPIASGETIAVGTNVATTTLAAEIAAAVPDLSGYATTAALANYAPKDSPEFTGSISKGRLPGSTVGNKSVAIGDSVTASGANSYAEGYNATASGENSHTEGSNTIASGNDSHAEGSYAKAQSIAGHAEGFNTTVSGLYGHAEGWATNASNAGSHAEGRSTVASGDYGHAEGYYTIASGTGSHAEGYKTEANHRSQHVFGEFNVLDTSANFYSMQGDYVEIVGNGTSSSTRSNARTLDWNGNEWLAGNLTLGSTTLTEANLQALLALIS